MRPLQNNCLKIIKHNNKKSSILFSLFCFFLILPSLASCANYYTKSEVEELIKQIPKGEKGDSGLPNSVRYLLPEDSLEKAIADGVKTIYLVGGEVYDKWQGVTINEPLTINGNGATVKFFNKSTHGWLITSDNVRLYDIDFQGTSSNTDAYASFSDYWAIKAVEQMITIENCHFNKFIGAIGLVMSAINPPEYFNGSANISSNHIENCFCGIYRVGRYEFGRDCNNRYFKCVIAIYDMAGNWTTTGAKATACRIPYITADWVMKFQANGIQAASSNNGHGTLVGCEFNHANNIEPYHKNVAILKEDGSKITLANGLWLHGEKVLPPTMVGLTLYYCDVNIDAAVKGYGGTSVPIRMSDIVCSTNKINNASPHTTLVINQLVKQTPAAVELIGKVKVLGEIE